MSAIKLISDPATLVLTLSDAKEHLRVEIADEDDLITQMIHSARRASEAFLARHLVAKAAEEYFDCFPSGRTPITLSVGPLNAVTNIKYWANSTDGAITTWASTNYDQDNISMYPRIAPKTGIYWPTVDTRLNAVVIEFTTQVFDATGTIPEDVVHAMKLMIGSMYEKREDFLHQGQATSFIIPTRAKMLLKPYRVWEF